MRCERTTLSVGILKQKLLVAAHYLLAGFRDSILPSLLIGFIQSVHDTQTDSEELHDSRCKAVCQTCFMRAGWHRICYNTN